ncbi:hypothetical protein NDU88_001456 [Pleurodeles waltl]|uniref:Uncharacterized protein n=1 Tax=Pleurodeles waltl TaxID=8319 RepID=A0AAV7SZD1_PLEWA|nr:hypothetical protein NDU88_001456 [Pleurodeles waltl]
MLKGFDVPQRTTEEEAGAQENQGDTEPPDEEETCCEDLWSPSIPDITQTPATTDGVLWQPVLPVNLVSVLCAYLTRFLPVFAVACKSYICFMHSSDTSFENGFLSKQELERESLLFGAVNHRSIHRGTEVAAAGGGSSGNMAEAG